MGLILLAVYCITSYSTVQQCRRNVVSHQHVHEIGGQGYDSRRERHMLKLRVPRGKAALKHVFLCSSRHG